MRKQPFVRPFDVFLAVLVVIFAVLLLITTLPREKLQPSVGYTVAMPVPALDAKGQGVTTYLVVETKKGNGKTLANIDVLSFWVDTQQSIRTARSVAEEITGMDTDKIDIIYGIDANNASLVGGPSAGAALTVATIAVLEGRQPNSNVMITGTIEANKSVGAVGGVFEKAKAAKLAGATLFLVPPGESFEIVVEPVENCTKEMGFVYCEKTYTKRTVDIGNETGINMIEIYEITDALPYFFQ